MSRASVKIVWPQEISLPLPQVAEEISVIEHHVPSYRHQPVELRIGVMSFLMSRETATAIAESLSGVGVMPTLGSTGAGTNP